MLTPCAFISLAKGRETSSTRSLKERYIKPYIRRYCLFGAQASGNADRFKGFAEECMAEYDLDGWKVPDLTDPGELSYHVMRGAGR